MSVLLFTLGSLNLAPMSSRFLNKKTLGDEVVGSLADKRVNSLVPSVFVAPNQRSGRSTEHAQYGTKT